MKQERRTVQKASMLHEGQPFSRSFTPGVSADGGDGVACLRYRRLRGSGRTGDWLVSSLGSWRGWAVGVREAWAISAVRAHQAGWSRGELRMQGIDAAAMPWGGPSRDGLGGRPGEGLAWPHPYVKSLLWTFIMLGMSRRTVWTKTIDEIRLKTTSEESQEAWVLVIRNSWSLKKSSCTRWVWTWIWNVKLRMHRVQK